MADTRTIILVHTTPAHRNGCDPAIDLDADGIAALLSAYQRTRSDEDRAKIPLRHGARCAEFVITRLSQAALRYVMAGRNDVERAQFACLAGCHAYTDAEGREHKARVTTHDAVAYADDAWIESIGDEYGATAVQEIGATIIQWTQAPRRALAPFGWAPGLVLAR